MILPFSHCRSDTQQCFSATETARTPQPINVLVHPTQRKLGEVDLRRTGTQREFGRLSKYQLDTATALQSLPSSNSSVAKT